MLTNKIISVLLLKPLFGTYKSLLDSWMTIPTHRIADWEIIIHYIYFFEGTHWQKLTSTTTYAETVSYQFSKRTSRGIFHPLLKVLTDCRSTQSLEKKATDALFISLLWIIELLLIARCSPECPILFARAQNFEWNSNTPDLINKKYLRLSSY